MPILLCPHCNSKVLFRNDTCPACLKNLNEIVVIDTTKVNERKNKISSKMTFFWKYSSLIISILIFTWIAQGFLDSNLESKISGQTYKFILLIIIIPISVYMFINLSEIIIDDEYVYIKKFFAQRKIKIENIRSIDDGSMIMKKSKFLIYKDNNKIKRILFYPKRSLREDFNNRKELEWFLIRIEKNKNV